MNVEQNTRNDCRYDNWNTSYFIMFQLSVFQLSSLDSHAAVPAEQVYIYSHRMREKKRRAHCGMLFFPETYLVSYRGRGMFTFHNY